MQLGGMRGGGEARPGEGLIMQLEVRGGVKPGGAGGAWDSAGTWRGGGD